MFSICCNELINARSLFSSSHALLGQGMIFLVARRRMQPNRRCCTRNKWRHPRSAASAHLVEPTAKILLAAFLKSDLLPVYSLECTSPIYTGRSVYSSPLVGGRDQLGRSLADIRPILGSFQACNRQVIFLPDKRAMQLKAKQCTQSASRRPIWRDIVYSSFALLCIGGVRR